MKRSSRPRQHTDVLMLPVDARRAEELARRLADPAPDADPEQFTDEVLELVLGIAAVEDSKQRQGVALAAALAVYSQTRHCENDLARYMAEYYRPAQE